MPSNLYETFESYAKAIIRVKLYELVLSLGWSFGVLFSWVAPLIRGVRSSQTPLLLTPDLKHLKAT